MCIGCSCVCTVDMNVLNVGETKYSLLCTSWCGGVGNQVPVCMFVCLQFTQYKTHICVFVGKKVNMITWSIFFLCGLFNIIAQHAYIILQDHTKCIHIVINPTLLLK